MNAATMNTATHLEAGGLVLPKSKVDAATTEQIVARGYRHPALGERVVICLASNRLGQAEDVAMQFLGFDAPAVSPTIAVQRRRSLDFASWALINDPDKARFALDLVKRMKKTARQARSKPGHAWDAYVEMAKELGRSARNLLPAFWEEIGRTFKELENHTYAGRALNKSLEAERVHAIESDKARRRDVVLEFALAGCLSGNALSEYGNDLLNQYPAPEAYAIFRDLCTRRTSGGMAPWAAQPRDFMKLAKAAKLDEDKEFESWLEEIIEAPAMARAANQFWKSAGAACRRIVGRNPSFPVALLRHTRPDPRLYGESKLGPWFELLAEWGVLEYLWEDEHQGAPPLGEPVAHWFARIVADTIPAPATILEMLTKLTPRLKKEGVPLALGLIPRWGSPQIDIDLLEACLKSGIKVDDPPAEFSINFKGWLGPVDHSLRNQDIIESAKDDRFNLAIQSALPDAIACRGGEFRRDYQTPEIQQRPFPVAAGDRPGIMALWRQHAMDTVRRLENTGLPDFEAARNVLESTLWPDTLRLFAEVAERLRQVDPVTTLVTTLRAGVFDEYGLPGFEKAMEEHKFGFYLAQNNDEYLPYNFPNLLIIDKVHAHVIHPDGRCDKHELRLKKNMVVTSILAVGNDLAVIYRDLDYKWQMTWLNNPEQQFEVNSYSYAYSGVWVQARLDDGSVFMGTRAIRPGDKEIPVHATYYHDRERFWRLNWEYTRQGKENYKLFEIQPHSGKILRESVPAWFEDSQGGTAQFGSSDLLPMPPGAEDSPLGAKDGLIGWKAIWRNGAFVYGEGIDGRRWEKPLPSTPIALLRRPGTDDYLPVTSLAGHRQGAMSLWDPTGSTVVAKLTPRERAYAQGQIAILPLRYWHFLKVRDEASSRILRKISHAQCVELFQAAAIDRGNQIVRRDGVVPIGPIDATLPAVKKLLPTAPERLAIGVARIVRHAEQEAFALTTLREKAGKESTEATSAARAMADQTNDVAAAQWGMPALNTYFAPGAMSVSAHIAAAAEFLKGQARPGPLPPTNFIWFYLIENVALACWQTYWRATAARLTRKDGAHVPWIEFFTFWQNQGIAELPGKFELFEAHPEGAKKNTWGSFDLRHTPGVSVAIEQGEDRFIVIDTGYYNPNQPPNIILRYSTAVKPGKPAGYTITSSRKVKAMLKPDHCQAFIKAVQEAGDALPVPTRDELAEVAQTLSSSPAEIALIWIGGLNLEIHQSNFLPAGIRTALNLKSTEAGAARQSLRNLNGAVLMNLFEAVVSNGPASPFTNRAAALEAVRLAWQKHMPKRLPLEAALQKKLSLIGKVYRWQVVNQEKLLALAADPVSHPTLQPQEMEIAVNGDSHYSNLQLKAKSNSNQVYSGDLIRNIVQLVGLVHADTPAGDSARKEMPALIKQTTKLLNAPTTQFNLRQIVLYEMGRRKTPTPTEWLNKYIGATKMNAQDGCARVDDGLIVGAGLDKSRMALTAFRSANLKDGADLARLQGIMALDLGENYRVPPSIATIVALVKSSGFQKLAKAILAPGLEKGQWPQNPLYSAPSVVKEISKERKLGDDAAIAYAQILALPDPTTANLVIWNGWTPGQFKAAAAELVKRKLVLEATRTRAGRSIFLPGEWSDLKAPWLPIETWKLAHLVEYDMDCKDWCPAGGPMVLRPHADLFAAAWKRVVDGDIPRYEEAKRPKKGK